MQGHVKRHFPLRSGDMQMKHKCPLCGHRHFRAATQREWDEFSGSAGGSVADSASLMDGKNSSSSSTANGEPWLPRTCKRAARNLGQRAERRDLERSLARMKHATPESVSASAHQLLFQSVVDSSLGQLANGAHMVPAEIVVDLLVDLRTMVAGTSAEATLDGLLEKANASSGLHMPMMELKRSLDRIQRHSAPQLV